MKRKTGIYFFLLLSWWVMSCEFELPTLPRLPERWNSKLIIPLLRKSYSFQEMVYDSAASRNNPIFADSLSNRMYYFAVDTPGQLISVNDEYWKLPATKFEMVIDLGTALSAKTGEPVSVFQTAARGELSSRNARIVSAIINDNNGAGINVARIAATLSDTLQNDLDIAITARNFKDHITDTLWLDTLHLTQTNPGSQLTLDLSGDSLFSRDRAAFLDSLEFRLDIIIRDTLRQALTQQLTVDFEIGTLHLESFYGQALASGYLTAQELLSSPDGAEGILFSQADADIVLQNPGNFESLRIVVAGVNRFRPTVKLDTTIFISSGDYRLDLAPVMAVLPDSITFYVEAALALGQYDGGAIGDAVTVGYQLYAPLLVTLPPELQLAAAQPTRFFITDSTTRANISRSQNGAQLDMAVTNRTPFLGKLVLLISSHRMFEQDSIAVGNYGGYQYINDTLYYIGSDTERVLIDTLAIVELPAAIMSADTLLSAGRNSQVYFADSSALALIADTCYFLPKFFLENPDSGQVWLKTNYGIDIESYLNLLFDPSVLNQTEADTADTTG
ncbi:MAG TPA: hypothetical protein ENN20_08980 [Candidatus Marinimicrobia bacterium]|nr:hypothetical protein [Candidatus Neomarinimicrobiota bacterium]